MQNSQDLTFADTLNALGGEALAGSGFEAEEPESGFMPDDAPDGHECTGQ